jgi:PAS domain S-box-containing protein
VDTVAAAQAVQHLDTLLASAPFGFAFFDRDLRFLRINEQLAAMNGISVAAHLGKTVAEAVPAMEATAREVTARILATGQPVLDLAFTGETACAPGTTRHWNESWHPVRSERGEIVGFSVMVVDVTERKQAEAALRITNDRFALAVKASQAVLWQQDLDLRFTWLHNPAPGIDGSDAVGKGEADLLERAQDVAVIEGLKREVMRSGVGMRTEFSPQIQGVVHCFELLMDPCGMPPATSPASPARPLTSPSAKTRKPHKGNPTGTTGPWLKPVWRFLTACPPTGPPCRR